MCASIGRATQGVTLIDIEEDDKVVSIARLVEKEDEDGVSARRRRSRRPNRRSSHRRSNAPLASTRRLADALAGDGDALAAALVPPSRRCSPSSSPPRACATAPRSASVATVVFEPASDGIVTSFEITSCPSRAGRRCSRCRRTSRSSAPVQAADGRTASKSVRDHDAARGGLAATRSMGRLDDHRDQRTAPAAPSTPRS